jgi:hypothetical protein
MNAGICTLFWNNKFLHHAFYELDRMFSTKKAILNEARWEISELQEYWTLQPGELPSEALGQRSS